MIVTKHCKDCRRRTAQNRTVKRRDIKYVCRTCGKVTEAKYPKRIKDSDKAKYLKNLEMFI